MVLKVVKEFTRSYKQGIGEFHDLEVSSLGTNEHLTFKVHWVFHLVHTSFHYSFDYYDCAGHMGGYRDVQL